MKIHDPYQARWSQAHAQRGDAAAGRRTPGPGWTTAQFSKTAFALLIGLAILATTAERALAFSSTSGTPVHQNITREALGFLKSEFLDFLAEENKLTDEQTQASPSWHCDGCRFRQSIVWHINGSTGDGTGTSYGYREAISQFQTWFNSGRDPADLKGTDGEVFERFGELLHVVQDLYGHSNWAELGIAGYHPESDLFDTGLGEWWEPTQDYQRHPFFAQIVIGQGEADAVPAGWSVSHLQAPGDYAEGRIMRVQTDLEVRMGLVSGVGVTPDDAHDDVFWYHDEQSKIAYPDHWPGMNKDDSSRPFYCEAIRGAVPQTTHEWDRLVNLIRVQCGDAGVEAFENATINYRSAIYLDYANIFNYSDDDVVIPDGSSAKPFQSLFIARHATSPNGATMYFQAGTYAARTRLGKPGQPVRLEKWGGSGNVRIEK